MSLLAHAIECFQAHPHIVDKFCETLRPDLIEDALQATKCVSALQPTPHVLLGLWLAVTAVLTAASVLVLVFLALIGLGLAFFLVLVGLMYAKALVRSASATDTAHL